MMDTMFAMNAASKSPLGKEALPKVARQDAPAFEILSRIGQEITSLCEASSIFFSLKQHVENLVNADLTSAFLFDAGTSSLNLAFAANEDAPSAPYRIPISDPISPWARCARERRELVTVMPRDCELSESTSSSTQHIVIFLPLLAGGRLLGVMCLHPRRSYEACKREKMIYQMLCHFGAIALDNLETRKQLNATLERLRETIDEKLELQNACQTLKEISFTDPLTGLRNRRFLREHMDADISVCLRRHEKWLNNQSQALTDDPSLLFFMVDIDHFKEVNDCHGHAAGDMVLAQTAERLKEISRDSDYLVRWGGEEFLIVARSSDRASAKQIAERIRAAVAAHNFRLKDGTRLQVTCSVGFSCFPHFPHAPRLLSWIETVDLADQALYMAKLAGRNTCIGANDMTTNLANQPLRRTCQSELIDFHI